MTNEEGISIVEIGDNEKMEGNQPRNVILGCIGQSDVARVWMLSTRELKERQS